jgi:hypothetical protein
MEQMDKHIQDFAEMLGNMLGVDVDVDVVKIAKPNRVNATKEMINDTLQIIKQIEDKPLTQEAIDMIGVVAKNALIFDEEDAKLVGKELTTEFKEYLQVVLKTFCEGLSARVKVIRGYSENISTDNLENKSKEELIAMIRQGK